MDDLISRAHVKALINAMWWDTIDSIPAVDAVEVRHGEWVEENRRPKSYAFYCSECKRTCYDIQPSRNAHWKKRCRYAYCPNCGARMDGRTEDGDGE